MAPLLSVCAHLWPIFIGFYTGTQGQNGGISHPLWLENERLYRSKRPPPVTLAPRMPVTQLPNADVATDIER